MEGQAKVRTAAFHPPLPLPAFQGCVASGVSLCGREQGREGPVVQLKELRGLGSTRSAGTSLLAMPGRHLLHGAEGPAGWRVLALPCSGCWCRVAAPVALSAVGLL